MIKVITVLVLPFVYHVMFHAKLVLDPLIIIVQAVIQPALIVIIIAAQVLVLARMDSIRMAMRYVRHVIIHV